MFGAFAKKREKRDKYGTGAGSINKREAPSKAPRAPRGNVSYRVLASNPKNLAQRKVCCSMRPIGEKHALLFVGDSQLEALHEALCDRTPSAIYADPEETGLVFKEECCPVARTLLVFIGAAGKWARSFPSFHTADIALGRLPSPWPGDLAPGSEAALRAGRTEARVAVVHNFASPHLLHVHPARPWSRPSSIAPLDSDRPKTSGKTSYGTMAAHGMGGCETAAAPIHGVPGGVRVFIRNQDWAASAWTTASFDYGATWRPLSRGAFPVFGAAGALTTASGVMLVGPTRLPFVALRVSFDGGASWRAVSIDSPTGASGGVQEVAPGVVLVTYAGWDNPGTDSHDCCSSCKRPGCTPRYQLLRVTREPPDVYPIAFD